MIPITANFSFGLTQAMEIAIAAYSGKTDKRGEPIVMHAYRVMVAVRNATDDEDAVIAAILHDAVEDSSLTIDQLRAIGVPERAVVTVDHMTRREGETYVDYIYRLRGDDLARQIKLADLNDNLNNPIRPLPEKLEHLRRRYKWALRELKDAAQQ